MDLDVEEGEQTGLLGEAEGVEPVKDLFCDGVEGFLVLLDARAGEAAQELFALAFEGLDVVAHGCGGCFEGGVVEGCFLGVVADETCEGVSCAGEFLVEGVEFLLELGFAVRDTAAAEIFLGECGEP